MGFTLKNNEEQETDLYKDEQEKEVADALRRNKMLSEMDYVYELYRMQEQGIDIKLSRMKIEAVTYFVTSIFLFVLHYFVGVGRNALGLYNLILGLFVISACVRCICKFVSSTYSYCVHTEKNFCKKHIDKYSYVTLFAERRYCKMQMQKIDYLKQKLQTDNELKEPLPQYIEERADYNVTDFFEDNKVLIIIAVVLFVALLFAVSMFKFFKVAI